MQHMGNETNVTDETASVETQEAATEETESSTEEVETEGTGETQAPTSSFDKLASQTRTLNGVGEYSGYTAGQFQPINQAANGDPGQQAVQSLLRTVESTKQEIAVMKVNQMYAEAEKKFPELDKNSPDYDLDFDNQVYAIMQGAWAGGNYIPPVEVAQMIKEREAKLVSRATSKAKVDAEKNIQVKKAGSAGTLAKSSSSSQSDSEVEAAYKRFQTTGDPSDYARYDLLKSKRK